MNVPFIQDQPAAAARATTESAHICLDLQPATPDQSARRPRFDYIHFTRGLDRTGHAWAQSFDRIVMWPALERRLIFLAGGYALEIHYICLKLLFFAVVCVQTIVDILVGKTPYLDVKALADLQWHFPAITVALPFFIVGLIQLIGVILNVKGYKISWLPRAAGANMAIILWIYLILKSIYVSAILTITFPIAIMGILSSAFLFWKACNNLPPPGMLKV